MFAWRATEKTEQGRGAAQYEALLKRIDELERQIPKRETRVLQPETCLCELQALLSENLSTFTGLLGDLFPQKNNNPDRAPTRNDSIVLKFRPTLKKAYRIMEKSLLKNPNAKKGLKKIQLDCSRILDVYGVMVVCFNYEHIMSVLESLFGEPRLIIVRLKNRYKDPSDGGWRDLMLTLIVDGNVYVPFFACSLPPARSASCAMFATGARAQCVANQCLTWRRAT